MTETKLCPMMFHAGIDPILNPYFKCVQERCRWWVDVVKEERKELESMNVVPEEIEARLKFFEGHCAALDWGGK